VTEHGEGPATNKETWADQRKLACSTKGLAKLGLRTIILIGAVVWRNEASFIIKINGHERD
jgi:hypothetical protein